MGPFRTADMGRLLVYALLASRRSGCSFDGTQPVRAEVPKPRFVVDLVHCVRLRRDVVPTADLLFFASPKKSRQKKGDPTEAVRLRRTALRCSVSGASRPTRFVRCAHGAQTNVAKSVVDAR